MKRVMILKIVENVTVSWGLVVGYISAPENLSTHAQPQFYNAFREGVWGVGAPSAASRGLATKQGGGGDGRLGGAKNAEEINALKTVVEPRANFLVLKNYTKMKKFF